MSNRNEYFHEYGTKKYSEEKQARALLHAYAISKLCRTTPADEQVEVLSKYILENFRYKVRG